MSGSVGFIGLGDMGLPMARRLLSSGRAVVAWNRSAEKLRLLEAEGAVAAGGPREVLERADLVGLCLRDHDAVRSICEGPDGLFAAAGRPARAQGSRVIADFSTGAPDAAAALARDAARHGIGWLDAPVSGGVPAASEGRLVVFAGGDEEVLRAAGPLLEPLASRVTHMGPSGAGQTTKLCNQVIVACNVVAIAETLALARKAGIDVVRLPAALKGGFADSAPLQIFGPRMAGHVFEPRLGAIGLMAKDVRLALQMAESVQADTPALRNVRELYESALAALEVQPEGDLSQLIRRFEQPEH